MNLTFGSWHDLMWWPFSRHETWVDFNILDIVDNDVILSMDWLAPYYAILDCFLKTMPIYILSVTRLEWKETLSFGLKGVISFLYSRHLVGKGCLSYYDYVYHTSNYSPHPWDIIRVFWNSRMCFLWIYLWIFWIGILFFLLM